MFPPGTARVRYTINDRRKSTIPVGLVCETSHGPWGPPYVAKTIYYVGRFVIVTVILSLVFYIPSKRIFVQLDESHFSALVAPNECRAPTSVECGA
jgi:hypothetical protein